MGDTFRDAGLKYASSLPYDLAPIIVGVFIIGWLWIKSKDAEEPFKGILRASLIGASIALVIQYPVAYTRAENYCRQVWHESGGTDSSADIPFGYRESKCAVAWPNGPNLPPAPGL